MFYASRSREKADTMTFLFSASVSACTSSHQENKTFQIISRGSNQKFAFAGLFVVWHYGSTFKNTLRFSKSKTTLNSINLC